MNFRKSFWNCWLLLKETSFSISAFCSWHVCFSFSFTKKNCSVFCSKEGNHKKTSILKQLPSIPKNLLPFCWRSMMLHSTAMVLSPPFNQKRFFMLALAYLKLELYQYKYNMLQWCKSWALNCYHIHHDGVFPLLLSIQNHSQFKVWMRDTQKKEPHLL